MPAPYRLVVAPKGLNEWVCTILSMLLTLACYGLVAAAIVAAAMIIAS